MSLGIVCIWSGTCVSRSPRSKQQAEAMRFVSGSDRELPSFDYSRWPASAWVRDFDLAADGDTKSGRRILTHDITDRLSGTVALIPQSASSWGRPSPVVPSFLLNPRWRRRPPPSPLRRGRTPAKHFDRLVHPALLERGAASGVPAPVCRRDGGKRRTRRYGRESARSHFVTSPIEQRDGGASPRRA